MTKIGNIGLKAGRPVLVGVAADRNWAKAEWQSADILEIRLDRILADTGAAPEILLPEAVNFLRQVRETAKKPLLLTIRRPEESEAEQKFLPDEKRLTLFESLIPLADAVDIETGSAIAGKVIRLAKRAKKTVIGSYHNFRRLPPDRILYEKLRRSENSGADICKMACLTEKPAEIIRLLNFCGSFSRTHLVSVVPMNRKSNPGRVAAPLFGSVLTYAALTAGTAPGQPDITSLAADLKRFYP